MRKKGVVLKHHPNAALVRWHLVDRATVQRDLTVRGRFKAGQHHKARGFARPRRPQHRHEFAFANGKVQILDHQRHAIIAFLHMVEHDKRRAGARLATQLSARLCHPFLPIDVAVGRP